MIMPALAPGRMPSPAARSARCTTAVAATVAATVLAVLLSGCTAPVRPTAGSSADVVADASAGGPTTTHGYVEGAEELAEPRLSLVLADSQGTLTLFDLLDTTAVTLPAAGTPVGAMAGDGRFVYPTRSAGSREAVEIVDTGRWTVEHGDHDHYYRAAERVVGTVDGAGRPAVRVGDRRTAIAFPDSGEIVVLTHDELAAGALGTPLRVHWRPHPGLLALPFAGHLLVTAPDETGTASSVQALDDLGQPVAAASAPCPQASDATTTRVGAVVACADGAVLITAADGTPTLEKIPYPVGIAPPARSLDGRTGRPVLAGIPDPAADPGAAGAWQLDTRGRQWTFWPGPGLVAVSAAGDHSGLLVAVDATGRIRAFGPDGADLGTSEPLLAASVADPATRSQIQLVVDANRAYVSGPAEDIVLEVDYRDGARIARTFDGLDPRFLQQVG